MNVQHDHQLTTPIPEEAQEELKSPFKLALLIFVLPLIVLVLFEVFDLSSLIVR